jgi:NADPH:quinone reductase-like Zn-dependent oxidoreductase
MKAILLMGHGGLEMLRYGKAPDPTAGPGEVVVDIYAASVNAADYKARLGGGQYAQSIRSYPRPRLLGRCQRTRCRSDFAVGDSVFGVTDQGKMATGIEYRDYEHFMEGRAA